MMKSHDKFENETRTSLNNQAAQLQNLEVQMGQMASLLSERQRGNFPSTSKINPRRKGKEHCKVVTLRSGKMLEQSIEAQEEVENPAGSEKSSAKVTEDAEKLVKKPVPSTPEKVEAQIPSYDEKPIIPYPQRLRKNILDKQFGRFMDIFKNLHINIPFSKALEKMPGYVKFMKKVLSKKRKLGEYETVTMSEECSAILQKKLPTQFKDPSSFTIPYAIGNAIFERALCDLGASINLMPWSIFKKLKLGEARSTTITLQLADRSLAHPRGIIEDVLVKVDTFIFPTDFIILDVQEDKEVLIILGRPFLATGRAMIDVQKGELGLRVQEEEVTFNDFNVIKHPPDNDSFFRVDMLEAIVSNQLGPSAPLETSLTHDDPSSCEDETVQEYVKWMDSFRPNRRKYFESLGVSPSRLTPSIEKTPIVEEKQLPNHLRYAYLGEESTLPVIISSSLFNMEEEKLFKILKEHKEAIGWSLDDIKGIRPSMCMHRIVLEEDSKPTVGAQRCLNPSMKEVVWKEVLKWLDAVVIYPISDNSWVSPIQVLPKKGGTTVIINDKNELLPT